MTKVNELLLNEIFQHVGLSDYDVIQMISREVWKKKYDDVMEELRDKHGLQRARARWICCSLGDEKRFWKPEREVIHYGLGSIFIDESKQQMITRQQKRKYPTGYLYSIRSRSGSGNVWITEDELDLYRETKNAWAKDTHDESLYDEVWGDKTARTFVNSYYLSHFAKLFRIPKHQREYGDPDGKWSFWSRPDPWEKVWRFHRVKDVPKFLKINS